MNNKRRFYTQPDVIASLTAPRKRYRVEIDIVMLVLSLVLIIILVAFFMVNRIQTTAKHDKILESMRKIDPFATSFSLGQIGNGMYANISMDAEGNLRRTENPDPVGPKGEFIRQAVHGDVVVRHVGTSAANTHGTIKNNELASTNSAVSSQVPTGTDIITQGNVEVQIAAHSSATKSTSDSQDRIDGGAVTNTKDDHAIQNVDSSKTNTDSAMVAPISEPKIVPAPTASPFLSAISDIVAPVKDGSTSSIFLNAFNAFSMTNFIPTIQTISALSKHISSDTIDAPPSSNTPSKDVDNSKTLSTLVHDGSLKNDNDSTSSTSAAQPPLVTQQILDAINIQKPQVPNVDYEDDTDPASHARYELEMLSRQTEIAPAPVPSVNGYSISGIEFTTFDCPDGYYGANCTDMDLCGPNDVNKRQPITQAQFDFLDINNYTGPIKSIPDTFSFKDPDSLPPRPYGQSLPHGMHPTIRVFCEDINKYSIETCHHYSRLDANLNCKPFDMCARHLNGFKHHHRLNATDPPLRADEYYMCRDNLSVKMRCNPGSVYKSGACIPTNQCFGVGQITLPLNDRAYVQCDNDRSIVKNCDLGVSVSDTGVHTCKVKLPCSEGSTTYTTNLIEYVQDEYWCNANNESVILNCKPNAKRYVKRVVWDQTFDFVVENFPEEIVRNRMCVPSDDGIFYKPVMLRYTSAMSKAYPYDMSLDQYVCEPNQHRWDYANNKLIPESTEKYDTAAPCQSAPRPHIPHYNRIYEYPQNKPYIFLSTPTYFPTYANIFFWPVYSPSKKRYIVSHIKVVNQFMSVVTYTSLHCPEGFIDPLNKEKLRQNVYLRLYGVKTNTPLPLNPHHLHYFIVSGTTRLLELPKRDTKTEESYRKKLVNNFNQKLLSTNNTNFNFVCDDLKTPINVLPNFSLSSHIITFRTETFRPGHVVVQIKLKQNDPTRGLMSVGGIMTNYEFSLSDLYKRPNATE